MQTTLLGLAIAFILALLAALIGPYFFDWSRFRPQFEAEATRVIGLPVRVDGAIDARLLPTPSLRLRGVNVGARFDESNIHVEQLNVEFSLGSLLRGAWRADELTLNGLALDLGLDGKGRMDWASRPGMFNVGALTVDKLNVTGTLSLKDAASRTLMTLGDVSFTGDLRTAASVIRGDGSFVAEGVRYPFRLSTSRPVDGDGLRLRVAIDAAERPVAADLEGLLTFDNAVPRFDGALNVSRPAPPKDAKTDDLPWKVAAKVKADPAAAQFEQLEVSYGPDDGSPLKLSGVANLRLGAAARFQGVLTAKQLDADRMLARGGGAQQSPLDLIKGIRQFIAAVPVPPIPAELAISSDIVMLGGRPIQNAGADLRSNGKDWLIDRMEFRAPGAAAVTLSGRLGKLDGAADFAGQVSLDVGDPDAFSNWLRAQTDAPYRAQKPIRAAGSIALTKDRVSVEQLKAQIDGHSLEGSVALITSDATSRLDATLKADAIDLSALSAWVPEFADAPALLPQEMRIALDLASVTAWGQTVRPVMLQLDYGAKAITIERLRIGGAEGVMVEGNGAFDRAAVTGRLHLSTSSSSLDQIGKLITPLSPKLGTRIAALPTGAGNVWLGLALDLDKPKDGVADLHATLDLDSPQLKGSVSAKVASPVAALTALQPAVLTQNPFSLSGKLTAERGAALLTALGLQGWLAPSGSPAALDIVADGGWQKQVAVKATLRGRDVDVSTDGTIEPWSDPLAAALNLTVRKANLAPLAGLTAPGSVLDVALTSKLEARAGTITLAGIDASVGGARLRGRLGIGLGDIVAVNGEIGADMINLAPTLQVAFGAADRAAADPFGDSLLRGWRGQISFEALRATSPVGELRPLRGTIEADGTAVTLTAATDNFAGGKGKADLAAKRDSDGVGLTGHLQLANADGARLHWRNLAMPAGRVSSEISFSASGRSASALRGSLSGSGQLTLQQGQIAGLDARVFQAAAEASDTGRVPDAARLAALLDPILSRGVFAVGTTELPLSVKDGRLGVASSAINGDGARLVVSGGFDFTSDQLDLRARFAPSSSATFGGSRPEIAIALSGIPDAPQRALDVNALSSWLTLRTIDRETKRLEQIEKGASLAAPPAAPSPAQQASPPSEQSQPQRDAPTISQPTAAPAQPQMPTSQAETETQATVPPLPPPIEVKPVPSPPRPAASSKSRPLVLTPGSVN